METEIKDQYGNLITDYPRGDEGFNYGEPITSDQLEPGSVLNVSVPKESFIPPVDTLGFTQVTPTESEQKAETVSSRLEDLNKQLVGESALRTQEETTQGLPEQLKVRTDLEGQLKMLQAEAKAIPIQLQQEAEGRGITTGGLAPIERGRLRENAIKALTVSSTLEATRGNIALAYDLVDRAVKAKYDPIREEIDALTKNLDLIIKSPNYTRQEKNRAEAQKAIQDARKKEVDDKEDEDKEIWSTAVKAAEGGADAVTIRNIQGATTKEEALELASPFLKKASSTTKTTPDEIKSSIDQALVQNNAFGSDGKISWETYLWMRQNWINNGGTDATFKINYPINQYLDEGNQQEFQNQFSSY